MDARVMVRLVEAEKGAEASLKAIVQEGTEWCKATIATALDPATQQQGQPHFCWQIVLNCIMLELIVMWCDKPKVFQMIREGNVSIAGTVFCCTACCMV